MIVKVFQKNKNGKIEFTQKELEDLLNEVYWDGYNAHTWTYTSPTSITIPKYQVNTGSTTYTTRDVLLGTEVNKNEI